MQLAFHTSLCIDLSYIRVKFERSAEFSAMEEQLHKEFRELRQRGIKVKGGGLRVEPSNSWNRVILTIPLYTQMGGFLPLSFVTGSA